MTTWPGSGERPGGDVGVTCRVQDGVAELVLDRPERRNAISEAMFVRLREHVLAFGEDEAVRVVALRSAVPLDASHSRTTFARSLQSCALAPSLSR